MAQAEEDRPAPLPPDAIVGGVVAEAFEGGAGGGGVARAPKNERMLFWALIPRLFSVSNCVHFKIKSRPMGKRKHACRGGGGEEEEATGAWSGHFNFYNLIFVLHMEKNENPRGLGVF